jgi:hypothetical protein
LKTYYTLINKDGFYVGGGQEQTLRIYSTLEKAKKARDVYNKFLGKNDSDVKVRIKAITSDKLDRDLDMTEKEADSLSDIFD